MALSKIEDFFRDNIGLSLGRGLSGSPGGQREGTLEGALEGRIARLSSATSRETQRFEEELLRTPITRTTDEDAAEAPQPGTQQDLRAFLPHATVELPLPQRHAWLHHNRREFRLFQMTDPTGRPAMQAVVYVARPRYAGWYGHGVVHKLGPAISGDEELYGLRLLRTLCTSADDLLTLRLQPRRLLIRDLRDFEDRARLAGFTLCEPFSVTRTLLYDLRPTPEQALLSMGQKLRRKIKARHKHEVEVRVLCDAHFADACQLASRASVERHGGLSRQIEWDTVFSVARERPDLMRVIGLFLRSRPDQLLAFASASRHGAVAEYTSAGSLDDPQLRKMPFNYWLVWELFQWAREQGSTCIDLGGITVGGPADPLGGVSRFKRHLTGLEVEIGREMITTLKPGENWAMDALRSLRDRLADRFGNP